jgi:hypothetical protein
MAFAAPIFAKRAIVRSFFYYIIEFQLKTLKFLAKFWTENGAFIFA